MKDESPVKKIGRPLATKPDTIARFALALFEEHGFENTTMEMIAQASNISRRTLFRYFPTKADLLWAGIHGYTEMFEARLANPEEDETVKETINSALCTILELPEDTLGNLRARLQMIGDNIEQISAVQTHYSMRYQALLEFMERSGVQKHGGSCELLARLIIGGALNAFIWWSKNDNLDLRETLDYSLSALATLDNIKSA